MKSRRRYSKVHGMCPYGCCHNRLSKQDTRRVVRRQERQQDRKNWKTLDSY